MEGERRDIFREKGGKPLFYHEKTESRRGKKGRELT